MPSIVAEPGIAEPGVAEPAEILAAPTILIRRPVLDVKIDGHSQTKVLSASCHFGFDARFATAEIVYKDTEGITPTYWLPVEITMGASAATAVPRFYGYMLPIDNTTWPARGTAHLRGPLGIAGALPNADNTWNPFTNAYGTHFGMYDLTGTVTKTAGSTNLVGVGTNFTSLAPGTPLMLLGPRDANGAWLKDHVIVQSVTDDTHLTLTAPVANTSGPVSGDLQLGRYQRGRTDQDIAAFILAYYGLSSRYVYTGGGIGDTIGGTGVYLGSVPWVQALTWGLGTPGLDYLDGLDQASAAQDALLNWGLYKTFETVGGALDKTIFRTLVTANPQLDPLDADFMLSEGVDLLRDLEVTHDPAQNVNGVRVTGASPFSEPILDAHYPFYETGSTTIPWVPVDGGPPPPYLTASSPYLPPFLPNNPTVGYPLVFRDFSFPLIERSIDDATFNDWDGLTAEAKARQLLQDLNTEVVTLRGSTYRDDLFGPAQTHYIFAPTRVGVYQTMWVRSLDITMSEKRVFRQHLEWLVKN